jgi:hypothetical protein
MAVFRVPAAITWSGQGSPGVNVWSVRTVSGTVAVNELSAALDSLRQFYADISLWLRAGTQVAIGPGVVERTTQEDHSQPALTVGSTGTGDSMPSLGAIVVSWRTSLAARRAMGRTFVGPLTELANDVDGSLNPSALSAVRTAADALVERSTSNTLGYGIGVWGLESPGQYDAAGRLIPGQPHVHRDITSARVKDQWSVMRSRRD